MSTSSGRLVDPRDPCRWTPRFLLGPGRARARPQPVRWPYSGRLRFRCHVSVLLPPAIQRRHDFLFHRALCVERYILVVISLSYMSDDLSASTSKRWTVIGSFRERFRFVCHLSTSGSNYNRGDSQYRFGDRQPWVQFGDVDLWRTSFTDVRIFAMNVTRRRYTWFVDVHLLPTYVFLPCVRICTTYAYWLRVPVPYASSSRMTTYFDDAHTCLPAYVSYQRMCFPATCVSTHVCYRRTRAISVRDSAMDDFGTTSRESSIRDYASGSRSRDYTEHSGSDEEDPLGPIRP